MNEPAHNNPSMVAVQDAWESRGYRQDSWLSQRRRDALEALDANGFPGPREEDWKYTDTRPLAEHLPGWLGAPSWCAEADAPILHIPNAARLVFVDGLFSPEQSTNTLPAGLVAGDLEQLGDQNDKLRSKIGLLANVNDSGFIAINTAFAGHGAALQVEPNVTLEQPVYLCFYSSTPEQVVQPRIIVDLGENSSATVVEHYCGAGAGIVNTVTEISCAAGASLHWDKLQEESQLAWHTAVQYARLDREASLRATQIDIGASLSRNELRVRLQGPGAEAEACGLFLADQQRHVDSRITVEHAAPDTRSRERYRGILADRARGVFNGRILVEQDAQKTAAELTNRNLLLSKGAEINTKPELEIYADDVKCAHGSTTGQLDETSMFYLRSRGIAAEEARNMLIRAFASELLTDLEIDAIKQRVEEAMDRLGNAAGSASDD
jgi:Fe-S cluster assembly protein SufD